MCGKHRWNTVVVVQREEDHPYKLANRGLSLYERETTQV
jgi:hypothetical protein